MSIGNEAISTPNYSPILQSMDIKDDQLYRSYFEEEDEWFPNVENNKLTSLCDGDGRKQAGESVRGGYLAFGVDSLHCATEES